MLPLLTIPEPLYVSEKGSFAYYTFTHRLPTIIERVIAENRFYDSVVERLEGLSEEILTGLIREIKNDQGADVSAWYEYVKPYLGKRFIDTPFYFAEAYFYRRILEATEYFLSPESDKIDPFYPQKYGSLGSAMNEVSRMAQQVNEFKVSAKRENQWQFIINLLVFNLWGNRADLSLRPTEAGQFEHQETNQAFHRILLNDSREIADKLNNAKFERLDFIVDNAGLELISDLFLMDFLLDYKITQKVYIHLKAYPTFVSDATVKDVQLTLDFLADYPNQDVKKLAHRLQAYKENQRLQLFDDFFWTSPRFFWDMPEPLRENLAQSDLVFIKGDANYRRLVGDCHWNKTSSFNDIVCYFPTALVSLRTLKSEVIVGLSHEQIQAASEEDPHWLTNGNWGIIQLFEAEKMRKLPD
ncbi:damage-control phosphatase ARMT1 family protein [Gloeothece verrucosa]|uniref:Damage-control phosphatase ARMT1-like metal-binding domain-containing protein n=1 Tax=Gloeothece verrucosa (strain PCC 7822) TaxID=497965 RepID=E0UJK9_GLOV7|nr:damage-control phosphatase ARMT1 family protein [Gloeothece verrucosa]ADN12253.1 protein of unknown function DUF89 [Gloeothece verrucosa PCC 7822]